MRGIRHGLTNRGDQQPTDIDGVRRMRNAVGIMKMGGSDRAATYPFGRVTAKRSFEERMNMLKIPHHALVFVGDGRKALFLRNDGDATWGGGLNWYVNGNVRFMFDYLHGNIAKQISPTNSGNAGAQNPAAVRLHRNVIGSSNSRLPASGGD
jgi:hypothetical protein